MMVMKVMVMKVVVSVQKDRVLYREGVSQRAACILKLYWQDTRVRSLGFACCYIIVYNVEVWRCGVFEWQSVCILSVLCLLWRWDRLIIWNKKRTGGQTRVCGGGGGGGGGPGGWGGGHWVPGLHCPHTQHVTEANSFASSSASWGYWGGGRKASIPAGM